jgi:acyl-coenzyme A thioesterase PaaI-like protein
VIRAEKVAFPTESQLYPELAKATFHDAFESDLTNTPLSPLEIAIRYVRATPDWVEALLSIRNRMVAPLGIRDGGQLGDLDDRPASAYEVGDRFSVFKILSIGDDELVVGATDSHLDVRISFLKRVRDDRSTYVLASWVHTHNALGRLYMIPVGRIHPLVVKAGMRALAL